MAGEEPHLPHLKTRAMPGAQLRQPDGAPTCEGGLPSLPLLNGGGGGGGSGGILRRQRSGAWGGGSTRPPGPAADRYAESQRDAVRVAYVAQRWNKS